MKKLIEFKLKENRGLTIITWLVLVATVALAITAALPFLQEARQKANSIACAQGIDTVRRELTTEFIQNNNQRGTPEEAKDFITVAMMGWDDICPDMGTVHLVSKGENLPYDAVCGLHGSDLKQLTRLNADYVLEQLKAALITEQRNGNKYPETLTYKLHGRERTAKLVDYETGLKWGTRLNSTYNGIVAFYSIVGHSTFGQDSGAEEGTIWYFSYADEEHCANWSSVEMWTGDSYRGMSTAG